MRRLAFALLAVLTAAAAFAKSNIDYVNMMIGSYGERGAKYGGTVPAVSMPFGMTQWVPSTRVNNISRTMYYYKDTSFIGFMATHQPAIWMADYGFITLMPQLDELKIGAEERKVPFSHNDEVSTPYYYKVGYGGINAELTATSRAAFFRISYPKGHRPLLMIEAGRERQGGGIWIVPEKNEIYVYNCEQMNSDEDRPHANIGPKAPGLKCSYVMHFSKPFKKWGTWRDNTVAETRRDECGAHVGGYVEFDEADSNVEIRIGNSFIDNAQAEYNLNREIPANASFEQVKAGVRKTWAEKLDLLEVEGGTADQLASLYTAMVHTLQYPREASEYGRYYSPFDGKIHEGTFYNDYSLWDTFRAEHPFLQLVCPERVNGMVEALIHMYEQGGWLPKWPNPSYSGIMIGSPADAVIADAYINGFRGYDVEKAYEAMRKDALVPPDGDDSNDWADREAWTGNYESRGGLTNYLKLGYVACDKTKESVSRTMEFALEDYCVAQMAKALGKTSDYSLLMKNALNYRNLYNPETGFYHARKTDGSWAEDPEEGFTEGDKWTYRFCFMQDVVGAVKQMGGKKKFMEELDKNFTGNHYRHINEPGHHYAFLYDYCGRLDKVQRLMPGIIEANYRNEPDGLSGNDDCGQMSAWLIYASMGFYPVLSASGEYALGIPAYKRVTLHLPKGDLKIEAPQLGTSPVLDKVYWNGKKLGKPFVKVSDIMKGGRLTFK